MPQSEVVGRARLLLLRLAAPTWTTTRKPRVGVGRLGPHRLGALMSAFSNVDAAADPRRLISSLEDWARGLASMKHYMAVTHSLRSPAGWILDVGCGAGHDVAVLAHHNIARVVGIDPSRVMLETTRERTRAPLAQAGGEALPFRTGSFAGAWIERVLMHVSDPPAVLAEVVRVVEPEGVVTIFEPDWSSLTVNGWSVPTAWTTIARHPSIGSDVGKLMEQLGCFVRDRVEERSWWTFPQFEAITTRATSRAAANGGSAEVQRWIDDVHASAERGTFSAEMVKVGWIGTTPPPV